MYNCRSANTWKDDLALTATYFPHSKLTFAILFGCTKTTEQQVLNRIANAQENAFHPLLLSGIFAELERLRVVEIVEATMDDIEGAIFELDSGTATKGIDIEFSDDGHPAGMRYTRRNVWLNTSFLRSRLRIWKIQLQKMIEHLEELSRTETSSFQRMPNTRARDSAEEEHERESTPQFERTSGLIRNRLRAIIEEYDEKIDECSMRIDGMTIATQWVGSTCLIMNLPRLTDTVSRRHDCRYRDRSGRRFQANAIHLTSHNGFPSWNIFRRKALKVAGVNSLANNLL